MRSRYHSCKSSGWRLKCFLHGAESSLLAPIGITRYPLSGKARFCIAPRDTPGHFSLCRMITNLRIKRSRTQLSVPFLHPIGQIQTTGDTLLAHGGIRTREIRAEQAQRSKDSSGIHFGTSLCTAVKDHLKHWLESTLQAYFTKLYAVFHGKKAANSYLSPQLNCFSSFSTTNFRKGSGSKTSIIGPKERIRITISDSSSWAYLIFTR